MNYFDAVTDLGLGAALVYRSDAREQRIASTAFWIGFLGAAGLAVLLWFLAPLFASFGPGQETVWLLRVLSLQFPLSALGKVHEYRIRASLDFKKLVRPFAVSTFVKGAVAVVAAAFGAGVWSLVIGQLVGTLVRSIWLWRVEPWRPRRGVLSDRDAELAEVRRRDRRGRDTRADREELRLSRGRGEDRRDGTRLLLPCVPTAGAGRARDVPSRQRGPVPVLRALAGVVDARVERRTARRLRAHRAPGGSSGAPSRPGYGRARGAARVGPLRLGVATVRGTTCVRRGVGIARVARDAPWCRVQGDRPLVAADLYRPPADRRAPPGHLDRRRTMASRRSQPRRWSRR